MAERRGLIQTTNFPRVTGGFRELPVAAGFDKVVLLLDFAGADQATNITDLSNSAHDETFVGNAKVDTTITFLGENTLELGGGADEITYPDSDDWDFGTGDFTVEFGVRFINVGATSTMISNFLAATSGWWVQWFAAGPGFRFGWEDNVIALKDFTALNNVNYHVAVTREGTNLRIFVDGNQIGTTVTDSTNMVGSTATLKVGRLDVTLGQYHFGHIGGVRITKGIAHYTANFTPLTVFYPTS